MLECINKKCSSSKDGICVLDSNGDYEKCVDRKIHTPTYAEEQLNHAIEKENRCYNEKCQHNVVKRCGIFEKDLVCKSRIKEPINYEEEYNRLKAENKKILIENADLKELKSSYEDSMECMNEGLIKLKKENEELQKELKDIKHIYYNSNISEVKEENKQLKERNILLEEKDQEQEERIKIQKSTIIELKEEIGKILSAGDTKIKELESIIDSLKLKAAVTEKLEIEINNLNEIIERKDKEIHDLQISHNVIEQENNQLKFNMEELGQMVDEGEEEIKQLKTRMENRQVAIKSLSEGKQKLKESIEIKDNIIDETMKQNEKLKATIKVLASLL